jgi:AhpD family alkylhydroperoxidase
MARTAALKPQQVPVDSNPTLDMFTKNIGFTPNMMASFAQSPIAFNAWAALLGSLSKALDVKTLDSIGLAVSEVNGCNYCLTVHSFTAERMAKLPADEIMLARKGHASDPKRDAAVQFARKVIETRGRGRRALRPEATRSRLGRDDPQISAPARSFPHQCHQKMR